MSIIQDTTDFSEDESYSYEVSKSEDKGWITDSFEEDHIFKESQLLSINEDSSSSEGPFQDSRNIMNSTSITDCTAQSTPIKMSIKRTLSRSIETPRIIKKQQDFDTPVYTSRIPPSPKNISSEMMPDSSIEDVIDVSSESEVEVKSPKKLVMQSTLDKFFNRTVVTPKTPPVVKTTYSPVKVSITEYNIQREKVQRLEQNLLKAENWLRTVNMEHLPDKGASIKEKHLNIENTLVEAMKKFSSMEVEEEKPSDTSDVKIVAWEELEKNADLVQPKTFGKQAMETYNTQKSLTVERLQELHSSLETCPRECDLTEDPKGLKIALMPHQQRALTWLLWREKKIPSGGILADDMGLGKTLTMISLMMKTKELEGDDSDGSDDEDDAERSYRYKGGTLVVCPASLINQWAGEIEKRTKRDLISCEMYHGPKRETKPKKLAKYDMVITTYAIIGKEGDGDAKNTAVFQIKWRRVILDEAHQIRNYKAKASVAACELKARSRWALTGTPVHNKEMDMFALVKFLRCPPFNELPVWKRWVGNKSQGGQERLHTLISSLMLRRTKEELINKGKLDSMPERKWELIPVKLTKEELDVYNRILIFSRTLFAQFLHQRADKHPDEAVTEEFFKMRKQLLRTNRIKEVKQHDILVLLLRLRQICCHPSLITGMLQDEDKENLGIDETENVTNDNLDFLEQLENLKLGESNNADLDLTIKEECGLKEATKGYLNPSNPVFSKDRMSSKIEKMLKILKENVIERDDKAIVVSQWSSYLKLIALHLKDEGVRFEQLDGTVPVNKRMDMIDKLNDPNSRTKVLLLSLTAGGVGLNLVGANHLFLLDLHWNPQLENQAQDRIYRMGQQKPVYVYKFLANDTIEERILKLQEQKLKIADAMLTGSKQAISSKLTLQDLKMLFEMK